MKKTISLIIVATILLSLGSQAFASTKIENADITPMWATLVNVSASLSINSLGIATCSGAMGLNDNSGDYKSRLIIELQKLDSFGYWNTIASWSKEGGVVCANDTYRAVSSGTYRVKSTGEVYDSDGNFIESGTAVSLKRTY